MRSFFFLLAGDFAEVPFLFCITQGGARVNICGRIIFHRDRLADAPVYRGLAGTGRPLTVRGPRKRQSTQRAAGTAPATGQPADKAFCQGQTATGCNISFFITNTGGLRHRKKSPLYEKSANQGRSPSTVDCDSQAVCRCAGVVLARPTEGKG